MLNIVSFFVYIFRVQTTEEDSYYYEYPYYDSNDGDGKPSKSGNSTMYFTRRQAEVSSIL